MPFLTIYIPSYNRGKLLLKQLEVITSNLKFEDVRIIVSDNCSDDSLYLNVKTFCESKSNFIYEKNDFNDTGNPNIFKGFLKSFETEYLWILSDNDLLLNGSVDRIIGLLKKNEIDLFLMTHDSYSEFEIIEYTQENLFINQILKSNGLGLISNVIYKTEFVKSNIYIGYDFIFTWFPHLAVIIKSFFNKTGKIGLINKKHFFEDEKLGLLVNDKFYYSRSYFGFVLLAELFEPKLKIKFLKNFSSFWNLRHWMFFKKAPNKFFNETLAYGYLSRNIPLFKFKIFVWKLIYLFNPKRTK